MAMEITNNYSGYAAQNIVQTVAQNIADSSVASNTASNAKKKEMEKTSETAKGSKADSSKTDSTKANNTQAYLRKLQKQAPYMTLEVGSSLSMTRDKRVGVLTINPKLLEKMQNDPAAEKEYIQRIKDVERAERTVTAYYNALGGCVERTSHSYIDENGKYYHFAHTVRDDKLNKKLREQSKENAKKLIEKTRKRTAEKKEKLQERLQERLEKKGEQEEEKAVPDKVEQLLDEKMANSKDGTVYLNHTDIQTIIEATKGNAAAKSDAASKAATKEQITVGANLDLQI